MLRVPILIAGALSLSIATGANAAVYYNNLGASHLGGDSTGADGPQYDSFIDANLTVDTIQLVLSGTSSNPDGAIEIGIYDDNGSGNPGALDQVVSLNNDSSLPSTPRVMTFGGSGIDALAIALCVTGNCIAGDDRFWVGIIDNSFSGSTGAEWQFAGDASGIGVLGEFNNFAASTNANGDGTAGTHQPFMMCVSDNGSGGSCVVPEPSSYGIIGLALVGLGLLRGRRFWSRS